MRVILIVRTFVQLRRIVTQTREMNLRLKNIEDSLMNHDSQICSIVEVLRQLALESPSCLIGLGEHGEMLLATSCVLAPMRFTTKRCNSGWTVRSFVATIYGRRRRRSSRPKRPERPKVTPVADVETRWSARWRALPPRHCTASHYAERRRGADPDSCRLSRLVCWQVPS
jgi:hypothetical protein